MWSQLFVTKSDPLFCDQILSICDGGGVSSSRHRIGNLSLTQAEPALCDMAMRILLMSLIYLGIPVPLTFPKKKSALGLNVNLFPCDAFAYKFIFKRNFENGSESSEVSYRNTYLLLHNFWTRKLV